MLRLAREELLELRGYLCDYTGKFNPRMDKLQKYWNEPKPEWERELSKLKKPTLKRINKHMTIPTKYAMVDSKRIQELWQRYQYMPKETIWEKFYKII